MTRRTLLLGEGAQRDVRIFSKIREDVWDTKKDNVVAASLELEGKAKHRLHMTENCDGEKADALHSGVVVVAALPGDGKEVQELQCGRNALKLAQSRLIKTEVKIFISLV